MNFARGGEECGGEDCAERRGERKKRRKGVTAKRGRV